MATPHKNPEMLQAVERALVMGVPYSEIVMACQAKWGVCHKTVDNYLRAIRETWMAEEEEKRPIRRAEYRAKIDAAWRLCFENKQGVALAKFAQVLSRFDGLDQPQRVQIAVAIADVRSMSPGERREEIDRLIEARKLAQDGTQAGPALLEAPKPTNGSGGNGAGNGRGNRHG